MEARSWFRMLAAPEGVQLAALLAFAAARRAKYPTFLLVQRASSGPIPAAQAALAADLLAGLEGKCVTTMVTDRWPGLAARDSARVRFYKLDGDTARALSRKGSLDDDLSILRNDKSPWLFSSSSKAGGHRFFLQLSQEEQRELSKGLPWLQLAESAPPPDR
jgi:hypothetical protein